MEDLEIVLNDGETGKSNKISVLYGTKISEVLAGSAAIAAKVNNKIYSLDRELKYNATIEGVFLGTREASVIYRRSLCYLLAMASHNVMAGKSLVIGHSIDSAYYYTIGDDALSDGDIFALENEMKRLVAATIPINTIFMSYDDAKDVLGANGVSLLDFRCPPRIRVCKAGAFIDLYNGPLVSNTAILKYFMLTKYDRGFLLRFPTSASFKKSPSSNVTNGEKNSDTPFNNSMIPLFIDQPRLFETYAHYKDWGKKIGVTCVAQLNNIIVHRKVSDFIDITEIFQQRCIADIALKITQRKSARVVLIAGPSSSGKTTTSKKLALELQSLGYTPKVISLDCYYAGHDRTPKDENGNLDFECLEALDIKLLNENLVDLFNGKEVNIPSYDFATGKQYFSTDDIMRLGDNEILIMEGIHALNPRLTPLIKDSLKYKIYLSALTQLNLDDHNRISTSDNRLIRRIVRDYQFRGKSAAGTIRMWPSVRRGEELHIFPFQNNADAILNTALDYELCVLKVYAEPLLRCVKPSEDEYSVACSLLDFLDNFATIDSSAVPERSIIREFIGGSAFKY